MVRHATVIGAGIVGVCCASYLLRDGYDGAVFLAFESEYMASIVA